MLQSSKRIGFGIGRVLRLIAASSRDDLVTASRICFSTSLARFAPSLSLSLTLSLVLLCRRINIFLPRLHCDDGGGRTATPFRVSEHETRDTRDPESRMRHPARSGRRKKGFLLRVHSREMISLALGLPPRSPFCIPSPPASAEISPERTAVRLFRLAARFRKG